MLILVWNEQCTDIHGLHPTHKIIVSAYPMAAVWRQFKEWTQSNISQEETAVIVAYNGKKCYLLCLWKLTQSPHSLFFMPANIKYLIDPYQVIGNYVSCSLNNKKLKMYSYELGVICKYINDGDNFNGAHDIMVDTKS